MNSIIRNILAVAESAHSKYGNFRSTHEAIGVALEEWSELQDAIKLNSFVRIKHECIDLAGVLVRLAEHCDNPSGEFKVRSQK